MTELAILNSTEKLESLMLLQDQVHCPVNEYFTPDTYTREMFMPIDTLLIGHEHKLPHLNIIASGTLALVIGDSIQVFKGPCIFGYPPGRKIAYSLTDVIWYNVWGIENAESFSKESLEQLLIKKSDVFLAFENLGAIS